MIKEDRITKLCNKAIKLKEHVVFEGEHELENEQGIVTRKSYFTFKGLKESLPNITITSNGKYTILESCTCKHHGIYGGVTNMGVLCAYVLAVYKYLGK